VKVVWRFAEIGGRHNAKLTQRGDGIRRQRETEPELARRRRAFEDADVPSRLPQRDAGREPADASADNKRSADFKESGIGNLDSVLG
jgi:hypothetical protein